MVIITSFLILGNLLNIFFLFFIEVYTIMSNFDSNFDSTKRFSDRVSDYVKYRPSYPHELIDFLESNSFLTKSSIIADVGSGTGLLTKLFLDNGNKVFGIEPNKEMREAGEEFLKDYENFVSINGTSEQTNLPDQSVDLITAGQAYHWFDKEKTAKEFKRILNYSNKENIVLIWNTRAKHIDFNDELEKIIREYSKDYDNVSQTQDKNKQKNIFFNKSFSKKVFPNFQKLDFEGLLGRLLSASYMLKQSDEKYPLLEKDLRELFIKYEDNGLIKLIYDTEVFYGILE